MADARSNPNEKESAGLNGITKAAVLLLSLESEVSATVLRQLDQGTVEEITRAIAHLDMVGPDQRGVVIEEFYNLALASQYMKVGEAYSHRLLCRRAGGTIGQRVDRQRSR